MIGLPMIPLRHLPATRPLVRRRALHGVDTEFAGKIKSVTRPAARREAWSGRGNER
jgi:hypothetical protein